MGPGTNFLRYYVGSTKKRDWDGAKGFHYTSDTMRNDIVGTKVAYDDAFVYFMVETAAAGLCLGLKGKM